MNLCKERKKINKRVKKKSVLEDMKFDFCLLVEGVWMLVEVSESYRIR